MKTKKNNLKIFLALIALTVFSGQAFLFGRQALAATDVTYVPVSVEAVEGKSFSINLLVNPSGADNYTAKLELNFPADLLQVQNFSFGQNWIPLSQPGYDFVDNLKGVLTKTAGYPGGFKEMKSFGTVNFLAKKSGQGIIQFGGNSFALNAENADVLKKQISPVSFKITASVPAPIVAKKPARIIVSAKQKQQPLVPEKKDESVVVVENTTQESSVSEREIIDRNEQREISLADVSGSGYVAASLVSFGTGKVLLGATLWFVIAIIISYGVFYFVRKSKQGLKADKTKY